MRNDISRVIVAVFLLCTIGAIFLSFVPTREHIEYFQVADCEVFGFDTALQNVCAQDLHQTEVDVIEDVQPIKKAEPAVRVLFVGDMMFDRGVAYTAQKYGIESLFASVTPLFKDAHAVIGNLEGTITNNESISLRDNSILRFTFKPHIADLLKSLRFTGVSLGNNHAYDFGKEGFKSTKVELDRVGIASFGSPTNTEALSTIIQINERDICFVGYHDLFTHDETPVVAEIIRIKDTCGRVVVFTHWGDEYMPIENARQHKVAHAFIDAGADLIIGAHPHVVQPIEIYKNKAIFYSLGNFIFDQNFSYETTHGLTVQVEWSEEGTRFTLIPISIEYQKVKFAEPEDRQRILKSTISAELDPSRKESIVEKQEFILWHK